MQKRRLRTYQYLKVTAKELVPEGLALSHPSEEFQENYFPATGFILGALPGEEVIVRVTHSKKNFFHAVIISNDEFKNALSNESSPENLFLKDPSFQAENWESDHKKWAIRNSAKERIIDQCDNFIACGGCRLMHLDYEDTLKYKHQWVLTHFQREKLNTTEAIKNIHVIPSDRIFKYRNHVQVHINKNKERGFYAPYSYRTRKFPDHGCRIFDQNAFDASFPQELELERVIRSRIDYIDEAINHYSLNTPEDKSAMFTYTVEFPPNSKTKITLPNPGFFQVNTSILPSWLNYIEKALKLPQKTEIPVKIMEIFSGFGFISRMLSMKNPIVSLGVDYTKETEIESTRIENNLYEEYNKIFFTEHYMQHDITKLKELHPARLKRLQDFQPDRIIINPPRSGFFPDSLRFFLENILQTENRMEPATSIVYSSCNAATLARDLKIMEEYNYVTKEIALFDFFPFTAHFEMVALINKKQ